MFERDSVERSDDRVRDFLRPQTARGVYRRSGREISALRANVGLGAGIVGDCDQPILGADIFLDHDKIGALRDRRAGKDAHSLARADAAVKGMTGSGFQTNLGGFGMDHRPKP